MRYKSSPNFCWEFNIALVNQLLLSRTSLIECRFQVSSLNSLVREGKAAAHNAERASHIQEQLRIVWDSWWFNALVFAVIASNFVVIVQEVGAHPDIYGGAM